MNTAEITVAFINPPKDGQKTGSIKTTTGELYRAFPDMLTQFQQGGAYKIEFQTREYEGRSYRTVKKVLGANGTKPVAGPRGTQSAEMWAMAVGGKALEGTGKLPSYDAMFSFLCDARRAWRDAFEGPVKQDPPFNDEIPFGE